MNLAPVILVIAFLLGGMTLAALVGGEAKPERKITWEAFWVLQVSAGSSNSYSRYTKEQCEEARAIADAAPGFVAACVPVPTVSPTGKPHGH